ncbi:hypothetical protein KUTeg_007652 [Tegillarca granosa]|uniref:Kazal-like domain-containing protein n=1 Tax=Tegillarca granosa TaxID=220873 RepID=A0ABQ9FDV2_TEGGR|nr:hypothetical protein KUTeg_007652 [Tegillarca granosa]
MKLLLMPIGTVCGDDNYEYADECEAQRWGARVKCTGGARVKCTGYCPCHDTGCQCGNEYKPTCATDGTDHMNPCKAHIYSLVLIHWYRDSMTTRKLMKSKQLKANTSIGKEVACDGWCPCPNNCGCGTDYNPVCGNNGVQYDNECLMKCKKAELKCNGTCPCPSQCVCSDVAEPVCGTDGRDYDNPCKTKCQYVIR